MHHSSDSGDASSRRTFLTDVTAGALTAALGATALPSLAQAAAPNAARADWDMTWVDRLTAKHRVVFDMAEVAETGLMNASVLMQGYKEVYNEDANTVLVMRHVGVHMIWGDAFWDKYKVGEELKLTTGNRNPYAGATGFSLPALSGRGATLLACSLAFNYYVGQAARRTNTPRETVVADAKAATIPGVILQPSGIFALVRAQEAGCQLVKSS